ncbi:hypothetical protein STFR1_50364 [Bacillus vallismortis]
MIFGAENTATNTPNYCINTKKVLTSAQYRCASLHFHSVRYVASYH